MLIKVHELYISVILDVRPSAMIFHGRSVLHCHAFFICVFLMHKMGIIDSSLLLPFFLTWQSEKLDYERI